MCKHPRPDISNQIPPLCYSLTVELEPEPIPELPPVDRPEFCVYHGWDKINGYHKCYNKDIRLTNDKPLCIGIKCGQYIKVDEDMTIKDVKL
jgi:hypothetical protein